MVEMYTALDTGLNIYSIFGVIEIPYARTLEIMMATFSNESYRRDLRILWQ